MYRRHLRRDAVLAGWLLGTGGKTDRLAGGRLLGQNRLQWGVAGTGGCGSPPQPHDTRIG
jgi:hypothetical protein